MDFLKDVTFESVNGINTAMGRKGRSPFLI